MTEEEKDKVKESVKRWLVVRQNEAAWWEDMEPAGTIEVLLDAWANDPPSFEYGTF